MNQAEQAVKAESFRAMRGGSDLQPEAVGENIAAAPAERG